MSRFEVFLRIVASMPILIILLVIGVACFAECWIRIGMQKLSKRSCPVCGKPFGMNSIRLARSEAKGPHDRKRFIAQWNLVCPHCQTKFTLNPDGWTIKITKS